MKYWEKVIIHHKTTLFEALHAIDEAHSGFAVIVDGEGRLEGIITDGDIRRALLRGVKMEDEVWNIANKHPRVFHVRDHKRLIFAQLKKNNLRFAPLIDEENRVVDVCSLDDVQNKKYRDNIAILMAGGLGKRLRPLTDKCPKPMLKVGNKPILETILESLISRGLYKFYISVNYLSDMIEKYFGDGSRFGVEIQYIRETKPMGTAGALYLLPSIPEHPAIVMNGDILTQVDFGDFLDFHSSHAAVATMATRKFSYQVPYGVIRYENEEIVQIEEKPTQDFFVNAGMYVLSPEAIASVKREEFLDMPVLFSNLIAEKKKTMFYKVKDYWIDIGHISDYNQAQSDYFSLFSDQVL